MITVKAKGSFANTTRFLQKLAKGDIHQILDKYGDRGVQALAAATPVASGETARAWAYRIEQKGKQISLIWYNSHIQDGAPIALLLQYGHGTGTGGYVSGRDYINGAMRPILAEILAEVRRAVTR